VTLRKGLQRLEGVADAKLIIKPPHMAVRMKRGYWPDLVAMQSTIKNAGYTPIPDDVTLVLTGRIVQQAEGLTVELDGMRMPVALQVVAAKEDAETAAHLARHVGDRVELEGRWQSPSAGTVGSGSPADRGGLAVTAILGPEDRRR
jgi:hypothetical protein